MSAVILRIEAVEARLASSYTCPRGIAGRIQSIRLRRHFQSAPASQSRSQTTAIDGSYIGHRGRPGLSSVLPAPTSVIRPRPSARRLFTNSGLDRTSPKEIHHSKDGTEKEKVTKIPVHVAVASYGDIGPLSEHVSTLENLWEALRSGDPFEILRATSGIARVVHGQDDAVLFRLIPQTAFSEILRCLDPKNFVGRHVNLFQEININRNSIYIPLKSRRVDQLMEYAVHFMTRIGLILSARQKAGFPLGMQEYKYLLRCARAIGDPTAAENIWAIMQDEKLKLDTECYNLYIATKTWSDLWHPTFQHRVRVTPSHLLLRQWDNPPPRLRGHKVGKDTGIKAQVTDSFNKMVQDGIIGDEETFCTLLLAQAREGDIAGAKAILKRVWSIDVNGLMEHGEEIVREVKQYALDSPFRPSETLLMTVAHSFSINNDVPMALRLVDFVSRHYSIPVPEEVWVELLERTYYLSIRRSKKDELKGNDIGQLPGESVLKLWNTLTAEPYNVKPTMWMYDRLIMRMLDRVHHDEAEAKMWEARRKHATLVINYHKRIRNYRRFRQRSTTNSRSRSLLLMERNLRYEYGLIHLSRQYIRRWVRKYVARGKKLLYTESPLLTSPYFFARCIPAFQLRWYSYLPNKLRYETPTGFVSFVTGSNRSNRKHVDLLKWTEAQHSLLPLRPTSRMAGGSSRKMIRTEV